MTKWGYALLVAFVILGASPIGWRKAGRVAALLTLLALSYAFHSYHAL